MNKIYQEKDPNTLNKVIEVLQNDGVAILPTETIYGLVCNASSPMAVKKMFDIKQRPRNKVFSVFPYNKSFFVHLDVMPQLQKIIDTFVPGPITVVADMAMSAISHFNIAEGCYIENEDSALVSIGVRMPNYPLYQKLNSTTNLILAATSVNISQQKEPQNIQEISEDIMQMVDIVVKGEKGSCQYGASTIIKSTNRVPFFEITRSGPIQLESLQKAALSL